jgi:hypothetical protein
MADVFEITNVKAMARFRQLWSKKFRNILVEATQDSISAAARRGTEIMTDLVTQQPRGTAWGSEFRTVMDDDNGQYYLIPWHRTSHRSSAPYDPPASFRGDLAAGIGWERIPGLKPPDAGARIFVEDDIIKLLSLEFGAPGHHGVSPEGLEPRPFIRPTIEQLQRQLLPIYRRTVGATVKRRAGRMRSWVRSLFRKKR